MQLDNIFPAVYSTELTSARVVLAIFLILLLEIL